MKTSVLYLVSSKYIDPGSLCINTYKVLFLYVTPYQVYVSSNIHIYRIEYINMYRIECIGLRYNCAYRYLSIHQSSPILKINKHFLIHLPVVQKPWMFFFWWIVIFCICHLWAYKSQIRIYYSAFKCFIKLMTTIIIHTKISTQFELSHFQRVFTILTSFLVPTSRFSL